MLKNRVLCLFLLLPLLLSGCGEAEKPQDLFYDALLVPEQTNYKTTEVQVGSFGVQLQGNALIEYPISRSLYWETADSYLNKCNVSIGDAVQKDDVLAVFDVKADQIRLTELKLQLQRDQAAFTAGKEDRTDTIKQAEQDALQLTGTEWEIALLQIQKLQVAYEQYVHETSGDIAALQEKIREIEDSVKNNTLLAPFDGIVTAVTYYEEGALVDTKKVYITLKATDCFLVKISDGVRNLHCNMDLSIQVGKGSSQKVYLGTVVSVPDILPISAATNYAMVVLDKNASGIGDRSAMSYSGSKMLIHDVIVIDRDAVYRDEGKSYVYVLEDNIPRKRFITEGMSSSDQVWVLDGLEPGQTLILN